jgi:hypothetical protein
MDQVDANEMYRFTESFRIQNLPLALIPGQKKKETERLQEYLSNLEKLYQAIQSTAGASVIVDSSKNPSYGYLLRQIPSLELYVLHFMRDSRAVAYSWSKVKEFQPGVKMARKMPVKSALQWDARNLMTELFLNRNSGRHQVLRYEDFIDRPRESIESVINLLGETPLDLPFVSSHTVDLQNANHSVFGNPVRFQTGLVELKLDNRWQKKMDQSHKLAVAGLTWPLQRRYGYF